MSDNIYAMAEDDFHTRLWERLLKEGTVKSLRVVPSMIYKTKQGLHRRWVLSLESKREKQSLLKMIQDYSSANHLDLQS